MEYDLHESIGASWEYEVTWRSVPSDVNNIEYWEADISRRDFGGGSSGMFNSADAAAANGGSMWEGSGTGGGISSSPFTLSKTKLSYSDKNAKSADDSRKISYTTYNYIMGRPNHPSTFIKNWDFIPWVYQVQLANDFATVGDEYFAEIAGCSSIFTFLFYDHETINALQQGSYIGLSGLTCNNSLTTDVFIYINVDYMNGVGYDDLYEAEKSGWGIFSFLQKPYAPYNRTMIILHEMKHGIDYKVNGAVEWGWFGKDGKSLRENSATRYVNWFYRLKNRIRLKKLIK
jgi:hypothetical protein